jgi:RNA polymerase sigma-70 factor (ECF subfamily)
VDTDAELLRQVAAGGVAAFDVVMRRHEDSVWRYVRSQSGSQQDAEDIVQETFISAWRHAASYRATGSVRAWLLTIARHAVSHYYRLRVGEPAQPEALDQLALDAGWGANVDDSAARDDRELLETALGRLPREDRELLVLRELEGFSGEETAGLLQLTLPAMKSRLHRARLKFVAALRELEHVRT